VAEMSVTLAMAATVAAAGVVVMVTVATAAMAGKMARWDCW